MHPSSPEAPFASDLSLRPVITAKGSLAELNGPLWFRSVQPMPIKLENVGIAVRDLEATIAFFTDLGAVRPGP